MAEVRGLLSVTLVVLLPDSLTGSHFSDRFSFFYKTGMRVNCSCSVKVL